MESTEMEKKGDLVGVSVYLLFQTQGDRDG
jgi:hypothetical protein